MLVVKVEEMPCCNVVSAGGNRVKHRGGDKSSRSFHGCDAAVVRLYVALSYDIVRGGPDA